MLAIAKVYSEKLVQHGYQVAFRILSTFEALPFSTIRLSVIVHLNIAKKYLRIITCTVCGEILPFYCNAASTQPLAEVPSKTHTTEDAEAVTMPLPGITSTWSSRRPHN